MVVGAITAVVFQFSTGEAQRIGAIWLHLISALTAFLGSTRVLHFGNLQIVKQHFAGFDEFWMNLAIFMFSGTKIGLDHDCFQNVMQINGHSMKRALFKADKPVIVKSHLASTRSGEILGLCYGVINLRDFSF